MILCFIYPIDFYNITEWISYFFITPLIYSVFALFPSLKRKLSKKSVLLITCGAILSVFLNRDFANSFWEQKLFLITLGAIFTILYNYPKGINKESEKN